MNLEFKNIPGWEGLYKINKIGVIKNSHNKILKQFYSHNGYCRISLCRNNKIKKYFVHRLVLFTFIGSNNGLECNHKNGIKNDNRLENLEWITKSENHIHRHKILLQKPNRLGKTGYTRKINQYTKDGVFIKTWDSIKEASYDLGYFSSNIIMCCKGKGKTVGGFIFKYKENG